MSSIELDPALKPLSHKEKLFVSLVLSGQTQWEAYINCGNKCTEKAARANSSRLIANDNVKAELKRQREKALEEAQMSRNEYIAWVSGVMTTPIDDIDEKHQYCQEKIVTHVNTGDGPEIIETKVKMVPKMPAAVQLAKVMGWEKPIEVKHDFSEKLSGIIGLIRKGKQQ